MNIQREVSLKKLNTFSIEAKAKYFVEVTSEQELKELLNSAIYKENPRLILGGGSNLLFTQDFNGLVVKISIKGREFIKEDQDSVYIKCGAGEVWHEFVLYTIDKGYAGIENLSLIPGTVGAAPMQNIGAYGVEIKEVLESVEALDVNTGEKRVFNNTECEFGYRQSIFKTDLKNKYIITGVVFKLRKEPNFNVSYGAIKDTLTKMGIEKLTLKAVSDAVISIRKSKLPDPAVIGNAGSFFKNPEVEEVVYQQLKEKFPTVPGYPASKGHIKVPAGWLIEQAGWKGKKVGETGVHKDQALVLVNHGNAKGNDVWALALEVQRSVKEKFGVEIIPEVNIV
jgi:UDP-N-acetylmuramate dehydrogenase